MTDEEKVNTDDIVKEYEDSPQYKLRQAEQEEKLDDDNFDAQQGYGYPEATVKENLFTFWKWFFGLDRKLEVNKTGNLETHELNNIRMYEDLAVYNELEGQDIIADYLNDKAIITLTTSLSKKGFGATLVGTQVRKVQRMVSGQRTKKGLFSKKTENFAESE